MKVNTIKKALTTALLLLACLIVALLPTLPYFSHKVANNVESVSVLSLSEGESDDELKVSNSDIYLREMLVDKNLSDRTFFTEKEYVAGEYIKEKFTSFGLKVTTQDVSRTLTGEIYTTDSRNIIGVKESVVPSAPSVIIGAHYDNMYYFTQGQGAYNNATGVAAMLALADAVSKSTVDFGINIRFVAFGANEAGLIGSKKYVNSMSESEKASTLLMVNFDMVGGGDNLYLYCDEVSTLHSDYIKSLADNMTGVAKLNLPPTDKRVMSFSTPVSPYSHYGLQSDNVNFLAAGINTAFFLALNWETDTKYGLVESENHSGIVNTSLDNYLVLIERYPQTCFEYMDSVANIVLATITQEDFADTMKKSQAAKFDYSFFNNVNIAMLIQFCLLLVVIASVLLIIKLYASKHPIPILKIVTEKKSVFGSDYDNPPDSSADKPF